MPSVTTKRFTLDEYRRLIELGFLTEDDRVVSCQTNFIAK